MVFQGCEKVESAITGLLVAALYWVTAQPQRHVADHRVHPLARLELYGSLGKGGERQENKLQDSFEW
jgi:hypothetical protein